MPKKKKQSDETVSTLSRLYQNFLARVYIWVMLLVAIPVFFIILVLFWLFASPGASEIKEITENMYQAEEEQAPTLTQAPTIPAPTLKENPATPSAFTARSAIAIDMASGEVLYKKDEKIQLWPASTTKIMTALIALEAYQPDDVVTINSPVSSGSSMGLVDGEKITVENLLYGLLVQSANDAAYALARNHPGGQGEFVGLMNQKATEIGLENTHFYDPAGFDNDKQFTTASDLALLSLYALNNKLIAKIVSIPLITVSDLEYTRFHQLKNVNQLLGAVPGVAGVKTGWTENAKENLVNLTRRNGRGVLTVILGSDDRFGETLALTNWAFDNYIWPSVDPNTGG